MSLGTRDDECTQNGKMFSEKLTDLMNCRENKEQCFVGIIAEG